MPGIALFDALTVAARRLNGCCKETLNKEIGDRPKAAHVSVEGGGERLTVTVNCPACKTQSVIVTDGADVKVDKKAGAATDTPPPPASH
jgi:Zn finger protein HypA/HybF involved in hydrogenase expression